MAVSQADAFVGEGFSVLSNHMGDVEAWHPQSIMYWDCSASVGKEFQR